MNMKPTIEINEANFETEVLKSRQPVLVEFGTGWSLPSMMTNGAMDEIAAEFVDCLKVARVQLDRTPNPVISSRGATERDFASFNKD